jgi:methyl-accepting chemotaxis protein
MWITILLIISSCITLFYITSTERTAIHTIKVELPIYDNLTDLARYIFQTELTLHEWVRTGNPTIKEEFTNNWESIKELKTHFDEVAKNLHDSDFTNNWSIISSLLTQLEDKQTAITTLDQKTITMASLTETTLIMNKIFDTLYGVLTTTGDRVGGLIDKQFDHLTNDANNVTDKMKKIRITEYILIVIILLASSFIALFTAKKILLPLNNAIAIAKNIASGKRDIEITIISKDETGKLLQSLQIMQHSIKQNEEKLQKSENKTRELFLDIVNTAKLFSIYSNKVASGDLTQRLDIPNNEAMVQLGKDLNKMTDGLVEINQQISQACHNMVSTLEEVRHAVDMQSSGATEQAASVNEVTASLAEIEKSSTQTMQKAKALGKSAEITKEKGQKGLEAIENSIQGMKEIKEKVQTIAQTILDLSTQTQQIGEITAVVNTLAQQSKMLALNASIEAAKAGDAGKGFAIVAAEVKNLAEQSEQSTIQVQKILEDIRHAAEKAVMVTEEGTKGVDHGTELVEQTGEVVRNLRDVIHETSIATQQIEAAIRQESVGIEQITTGMNEINQVTSSFVESARQTMEAIGNLATIAKTLKENIDAYKI